MNKVNIALILVAFVFVSSCREKSGGNLDQDYSSVIMPISAMEFNKSSPPVAEFDSLFKEYSCISLITSDSTSIGNIDKIFIDDSLIFIADYKKAKSIFIFDSKGAFISRIHKLGNAPGEFIKMECVNFNRSKKRIELYDSEQKKILVFNYQGHFMYERISPVNFYSFIYNSLDHRYYYYCKFLPNTEFSNGEKNYRLFVSDSSFNLLAGLLPFSNDLVGAKSRAMSESFYEDKRNNTYLVEPYNDTIYKVFDSKLSVNRIVNFEKNSLPEGFINNHNFYKHDEASKKNYSYLVDGFIIDSPYFIVRYPVDGRLYTHFRYKMKKASDFLAVFRSQERLGLIKPIYILDDSTVVFSYDPSQESTAQIAQLDKRSKITKVLQSIPSDKIYLSNPILIVCNIKRI